MRRPDDRGRTRRRRTIYREKIGGVRAARPQLAKLMDALKPGDAVTLTKFDRLGRSTR